MELSKIKDNWEQFEERNNLSTTLEINPDNSGCLLEFWDRERFFSFSSLEELNEFLINGNLKKAKDGRSVSPIEILK
ncbi:hypothetical protein [Tenacibaculum sp. nBUS_03]|uniref:hypothetical protein n=1 Tax=Tenacibaculum sp. nBUS_03 TaxID=3395320 RepID=UPI003EBFEA3E